MPGEKSNKPRTIAEKYSLDYYRRTLATRAWKPRWNYTALLLAAIVVIGVFSFRRNAAFQAAPVSSPHASFGSQCQKCHDQSWQTAWRMVDFTSPSHSVSDAACQACHRAADHIAGLVKADTCVTCHQEHRPDGSLTQLTDNDCTRCHESLALEGGAPVSFALQITQFGESAGAHPEFALLRSTAAEVGPRHAANRLAVFVAGENGGAGKWLDRGGLKFNHHVHLDPKGVPDSAGKRVVLACAECHQRETDGKFMRPINYETHCARCHLLRLSDSLSSLGELPHTSVEEVRGVMRDRISSQLAKGTSSEAGDKYDKATPDSNADVPRLPRLPPLPSPAQLSREQEANLNERMLLADHAVFGLEAKGMCRKCHYLEARDGDWHVFTVNPKIAGNTEPNAGPTHEMVPHRWLEYAQFDHLSHRAVECADCHQAAQSTETSDILLPSIATCRKCHGATATAGSTPVRADCVLCHKYHAEGYDFPGIPLDQLLSSPKTAAIPATER
jgi:hypothetical protein